MADSKYYAYCLVGFGNYLDWKTVEFLERLPDGIVCSGCGVVSATTTKLPCTHVSCLYCGSHKCAVDKRSRAGISVVPARVAILSKQVRCICSSDGCAYVGRLCELDSHYPSECDFARIVCSCCSARILFKELPGHYAACRNASELSLATSAKVARLIEDLRNAKKELEIAVASGRNDDCVPRASVRLLLDAVERLDAELGDGAAIIEDAA
ncbi:hypothetical protein HPB48_003376 [Haemaphysalis longicornis]|uniref:Uncharacterized protein n=1 Tax=Haemaphysalis longicornis TaxID=44386 RepID=A0A9J6G3N5_HAELO|nr:hypothetical protein HPB48_003376 [Haemaphysalis longicornis]